MTNTLKQDRLYNVWQGIKDRCVNPNRHNANSYCLKGITVCEEWRGKDGYKNFREWALANGYDYNAPKGQCTIDRINTDGNYEPSNCRWVSTKVQNNNTSMSHYLTFNGETHTIAEWADILQMPHNTLYARICQRKWPVERALTTPARNIHRTITYKGENRLLVEWERYLGVSDSTFLYHYHKETDKEKVFEYFIKRKEKRDGRTEK